MKIRTGFVSNSSSSSFILEFESRDSIATVAGHDFSMEDFLESFYPSHNIDTEVICITGDEEGEESKKLLGTLEKIIKWSEDENEKATLKDICEDIKKGEHKFAYVSINYHDRALMFLFKVLRDYELFKVRFTMEG